jgi:hypothetical protein
MKLARLFAVSLLAPSLAFAQNEDFSADMQISGGMPGMPSEMPSMNVNVRVKDGSGAAATTHASAHAEETGDGYKITWDTDAEGGTWFKVLQPEGYPITVEDGDGNLKAKGVIPVSFRARGQHFYFVEIRTQAGVFEKKFEAKKGMVAQLFVAPPPAAQRTVATTEVRTRPVETRVVATHVVATHPVAVEPVRAVAADPCVPSSAFNEIKGAIQSEDFSQGKLRVLEDAAESRSFCVDQTVQLLGMFDFENDKLQALQLVAPRLTDRENKFKIYKAFDFDGTREQAKQILK